MAKFGFFMGLVALVGPAAAQMPSAQSQAPTPPPFMGEVREVFKELNAGRYLDAIDRADRGASNPAFGDHNPLKEVRGQITPFITGTINDADLDTDKADPIEPADRSRFEHAQMRDAIGEIVRRARSTRIVILNEAHHSPRDRAFALQVARALRPLGYSILAAEAFVNHLDAFESAREMAALAHDGYPRLKHGHYTKDPAFGDFVRQSLAMGYRPVAYEEVNHPSGTPEERLAPREQTEANNLVERIFAKDRKAKVLIYVGYGHAAERPIGAAGSASRWMANRLKTATGIDPLTIDQTALSETNLGATDRQLYSLLRKRLPAHPVVLFDNGKPLRWSALGEAVDIQVVHPPLRLVNGRPAWLATMGRVPVPVPRNLLPPSGRRLVQAFIASEESDAIPVDQILVTAGRKAPVLMVPKKPIRFTFQDPAPAK